MHTTFLRAYAPAVTALVGVGLLSADTGVVQTIDVGLRAKSGQVAYNPNRSVEIVYAGYVIGELRGADVDVYYPQLSALVAAGDTTPVFVTAYVVVGKRGSTHGAAFVCEDIMMVRDSVDRAIVARLQAYGVYDIPAMQHGVSQQRVRQLNAALVVGGVVAVHVLCGLGVYAITRRVRRWLSARAM